MKNSLRELSAETREFRLKFRLRICGLFQTLFNTRDVGTQRLVDLFTDGSNCVLDNVVNDIVRSVVAPRRFAFSLVTDEINLSLRVIVARSHEPGWNRR